MAKKTKCKVCHALGAEIGTDGRCCGCRMALWATRQGLRYGTLMGRLYEAQTDPTQLELPDLPPVADIRRHRR